MTRSRYSRPPDLQLVVSDELYQEQLVRQYLGGGCGEDSLLWAMGACAVLIQRTRREVAIPMMDALLTFYGPDEVWLAGGDRGVRADLLELLKVGGLQWDKLMRLTRMTKTWHLGADYAGLNGVGPYFRQSWEMTVLNTFPRREEVSDHFLLKYYDRKVTTEEPGLLD